MNETMETNAKIFREYIDRVINHKQVDLLENYFSSDCVFHGVPYVGLGFSIDSSKEERNIINAIAPGSPAAEHLQVGDEVVKMSDSNRTIDTYEVIRDNPLGQGKLGSPVDLVVQRAGKLEEFHLLRSRIEHFAFSMPSIVDSMRHSLLNEIPDLHLEILLLVTQDDLLAYYAINTGTDTNFNASAIWAESGFVRFEGRKIVEMWSVEDTHSMFRQLGYTTQEPIKAPAA